MSENKVLLKVDNLVKHFPIMAGVFQRQVGVVHAVDGISFEVRSGETFGLVGEFGLWEIHRRAHDLAALPPDQRTCFLRRHRPGEAERRRTAPHAPTHADDLPGPIRQPEPAHDHPGDRRRAAGGA